MGETIKRRLIAYLRHAGKWMVALSLVGGTVSWTQGSKQPQPVKTPAPQNSATPQTSLPPIQLDGAAALHHLNVVISWYRDSRTSVQSVGLPSDAIYQDNTQSLGTQAVRLAFQSAKAEAALIAAQQKISSASQASGETTQQQNLAQLEAKTSSRLINCNRRSKI